MTALVIGRDSHINELSRRVGIAERKDGDVDVRSFLDSLGIGARIGDNDEAGFLERSGDVVGEVTRSETTSNSDGTCVSGELEDSTLTVWAGRDHANIGWVVNCDDDAGCQNDLLPGVIY